MLKKLTLWCVSLAMFSCEAQTQKAQTSYPKSSKKQVVSPEILPGACRLDIYLSYLKNKRVGVFANQTSMVGNIHLVDTLQKLGINIIKIFGPEHGFRGTADAGEKVGSYTDEQTGIKVISLYGSKAKPTPDDLKDVDILLFDIQDVGVRFYTYISSLQYFEEAAFENHKPLIILDRPNPNGFYVDGPVLDTAFRSFVGMQPIPVVYGMTIGEYARMLAGEGWLSEKANKIARFYTHAKATKDTPVHFLVVKCANYTHESRYSLPVKPSPNLPDMLSIYRYPSTCFFEGTVISEGRGTKHPFVIFGHPLLPKDLFSFTPHAIEGAMNPKFKDQLCYGWNTLNEPVTQKLELKWLLEAYQRFPDKDQFFIKAKADTYFFDKLAGSALLRQQIKEGKSEEEIRESWQPALEAFKKIRKKYLLYEESEER